MSKSYVELKDGVYKIVGSRVSLDSIVYSYRQGDSPETIVQNFPTLTLEQVYGAIAFYLFNQQEIDEYIKQGDEAFEKMREAVRNTDPVFYQKMAQAKRLRDSEAA